MEIKKSRIENIEGLVAIVETSVGTWEMQLNDAGHYEPATGCQIYLDGDLWNGSHEEYLQSVIKAAEAVVQKERVKGWKHDRCFCNLALESKSVEIYENETTGEWKIQAEQFGNPGKKLGDEIVFSSEEQLDSFIDNHTSDQDRVYNQARAVDCLLAALGQ